MPVLPWAWVQVSKTTAWNDGSTIDLVTDTGLMFNVQIQMKRKLRLIKEFVFRNTTISSLQKEGPEEFLVMTTLDFNMLLQFPMERQTWWTAVDDIQPTSPSEVFLAVNFPLSVWISHDLSGTHIAICEEGKRQCLQKSVPRINIETKFPQFSNGAGFRVRMGVPDAVITKTSEVVRIPKLNTDCKEVRRYAISCRVLYSKNVLEMLLWETRIKGFDMSFHCRNGSYVWCLFCVTLPWLSVKIIKHYSYSSK